MNKRIRLSILLIPILAVGCSGSADEAVTETKPAEVKQNISTEQQSQIAAKFKDPNFAKNMMN
jgi:hypothetical protein